MPFTFCHPAIVLPFQKLNTKWFSLTGLIIGSMIPDFEYFLRMRINCSIGHSFYGIFFFDLPLSIIISFVFFNIVAKELVNNLPQFLKSRLIFITKIDWNIYFKENWFVVIYSIIIGTVTHILWDSFTHNSGFFVLKYKLLSSQVLVFSHSIGVYKILQHGSTVLAALFILYFILKLKPNTNITQKKIIVYWVRVIFIATGILFFRIIIGGFGSVGTFIVSGIAAGLYSVIITSIIFKNPTIKPHLP